MSNSYEMGRYLQTLRKAQGRTQKELADRLGVSFQAVSKWENGDSMPDVALLLPLAEELETTTDKILSGGVLVRSFGKQIRMDTIMEGLNALKHLRDYFGAKSILYRGAMEGISQKMNLDFEACLQVEAYQESFLAEVVIQFLMEGYHVSQEEVDQYIHSEKMRNLIGKYRGDDKALETLPYEKNPQLFEQIRAIRPSFAKLRSFNLLPGEYIRMEAGKQYWGTQVEEEYKPFCLGIAVDETTIYVFQYEENGVNQRLIHTEKRRDIDEVI